MTLVSVLVMVLTIWVAVLLVPAVVLFVETMVAPRAVVAARSVAVERPRIAVLVPAHDEAAGIAASLATIISELAPGDRVLVVADNCSDDTAAVAAGAGAEVVRRDDPERRGKGYALDHGVRHLAASPPDVVLVVDADCTLHPGSLDVLGRLCAATGRPVQALDLARAPPGSALNARIAEFAWVVKNFVRPLGSLRLGLPCQLMGTGMAFPWAVIERAPLASGQIVEDVRLGLDLAAAGKPPLFCPQALVTSYLASTEAGRAVQRRRWEHGHIGVIVELAPTYFWRACRTTNFALAAMVLDVCVPPLAALLLSLLLAVALGLATFAVGAGAVPLTFASLALGLVTSGVTRAWHHHGRAILSGSDLCGIPAYALAKLPMYLRALSGRESRWARAERDDGARK